MAYYPEPDPIPLPAPVWLFKALLDLTLTAHLTAVDLLLGGLMIALVLRLTGGVQIAGMIVHRLPTVMAFVINLGVPPLLFAQVLYGRALYTSSVLIGAWWISVVFLLMASYYGLYYSAKRADSNRPWSAIGIAALLLTLTIAFIYSNNMTLMLRPQSWADMYRNSPAGLQWNGGDPTLWPRWLFFVLGCFAAPGGALMLLAQRAHFAERLRASLFHTGGTAVLAGTVAQAALALPVWNAHPAGVARALMSDGLSSACVWLWVATVAFLVLTGAGALFRNPNRWHATLAAVFSFLNIAAIVLIRDGVRDVTLRLTGFDVWNRQVATNWPVVAVFIALLLMALVAVGWLIRVVARASRIEENYA